MTTSVRLVPWYIELFGHLRLHQGTQEITRFRTRKNAALLAYLAYFIDRAHPREVLIEFLWPDVPLDAGRNNLSVSLNSLRRQLEPPGVAAGAVLIADRSQVRLNPAAVTTDVSAFEAAVRAGQQTQCDKERIAHLTLAANTYRGPLLPGFYDDWTLMERDRLADAYRTALRHLIRCLVQEHSLEPAIDYAHRVVQIDPLREQARRELMRLYIAAGRPEAALEQFHQLENLLAQTLGASASAATRDLAETLQTGRPNLDANRHTAASSSPTVVAPARAIPAEHAPLPGPPPGNLPLVFTRFFGREKEIQDISAHLDPAAARLVTLTGPGGVGKTRLAQETARHLRTRFSGGIWFVPLADVTEAARVPDSIREILGLAYSESAPVVDQVAQALSQRPALLVLDNLEHLGGSGAQVVQMLLERATNLNVLATSRQPLALAAEQEIAVPPLPTPEMPGTPERLLEFPSVQLFVDRAQAQRVDFQITSRNAAGIRALCARLEGLPLAIELAAAWAKMLTPKQMLKQMEHRFDFLVSRRIDLPERHRTLRAVIEGSYRLLGPEEQGLFAALSTFRGGWTLESAEAVCVEPRALSLMARLRDRSLVIAEETDAVDTDTMRYRMLESLREYASEQLPAETAGLLARRHAAYFLQIAEQAKPLLQGASQGRWLETLSAEHDNLRQALTFFLEAADGAEAGLRLGSALQQFWSTRGYLSEGRERLTVLLARAEARVHSKARADALNGAGVLAWRQGDWTSARSLHQESLEIRRELGDRQGFAISLGNLGNVAYDQGDYATARSLQEESLEMRRELGDRPGIAQSLGNLGNVAYEQGDYDSARSLQEESLEMRRELGDRQGIAQSLHNLANVAHDQGDYAAACSLHRESLEIRRELGDRQGIALSLGNLGNVIWSQGDYVSARSLHQESLEIRRELGDRQGIAQSLGNLGIVAHEQGDYDSARSLLEASLEIFREMGDRHGIAYCLINLGEAAWSQGDYASARSLQEESLEIGRELGNMMGVAQSLGNLGNVAWSQGDYASARSLQEESLDIKRQLGDRRGIASSLEAFAGLNGKAIKREKAARLWGAAERLREEIGSPLRPTDQEEQNGAAAAVRAAIGENAFAAAWAEGRIMTMEQAIEYALTEMNVGDAPRR
jgi:predicted ATPase/DNA-binding SARP family transcriptional activator